MRVLFYARKNYLNKKGEVGIMVRITINGDSVQFSSGVSVNPELWDTKERRASGDSEEAKRVNEKLKDIKMTLEIYCREKERFEPFVAAEMIRDLFVGVKEKKYLLLEVFEQHNKDLESLIGKTIAQCTFNRYERTRKRLADFMLHRYNISDIAIKDINYSFINDFETYLRTASNNGNNATAKFMQQFKRIVIRAKNNGWIQADPFVNYSIRLEKVDRGYLTERELSLIMKNKFEIKRLEHVRDIFIFSCFTGLSYIDVYNLKEDDILVSFDDRLWIKKKRQKTNIQSNILLLDIPKIILDKYKGKLSNGRILPVLSNQKVNSYLKEIGDLCGIKKNLTFHLARHTFATTITLSKGVPIETISKMLGHSSIKTTQIYARITDNKISHDMHELSEKLQGMGKMLTL